VTEKNLQRSALYCDVTSDRDRHRIRCTLDRLADRPESGYGLAKTIEYPLAGRPGRLAKRCATAKWNVLLQ